jgi:hypothetical protein
VCTSWSQICIYCNGKFSSKVKRSSLIKLNICIFIWGAAVPQLVGALHYKPAGRGFDSRWCQWIFHWHNSIGRTMALGSTQPLTEMSTRNISWGVNTAGAYGWQPTTFMCRLSRNLGASTSWNPLGLSRHLMELLYLLYIYLYRHIFLCICFFSVGKYEGRCIILILPKVIWIFSHRLYV